MRQTCLTSVAAAVVLLSACAQMPGADGPAVVAAAPAGTAPATPPAPRPVTTPASAPTAGGVRTGNTASLPPARPASGAPQPGTPPAATPPAPGSPPPFATVVKDAKKTDGLFTVWQKDDKFWLELKPEDFNKPFFLSPKISRGLGEARLFGGTMSSSGGSAGGPQVVEFRRVHNQVRLVAVNTDFTAPPGSPEARAVAAAFSPSLLSSSSVSSQPHPERRTVLVEANSLFVNDMQGIGGALQRAYRQGYSFDGRHSSIDAVRGKPDLLVLETTNHYYTPSIAVPPPMPPGAPPGGPVPTTPNTLMDERSVFFGVHYSIGRLPEVPMKPRRADQRVGYFNVQVQDFANDLSRTPKQRIVKRWRLEKKDPAAPLSEPVKPIVYWLDRTIPQKYRAAITEGVLEWNKAFEKIGFKDAIVVKVQPDDADFDTLDLGVASIRWMTNAQPSFGAVGPTQADPRTGEILDADIGIESLSSRSIRYARSRVLGSAASIDWGSLMQARDAVVEGVLPASPWLQAHVHGDACDHAEFASEQLGYALDVLEARGEVDPDSAEANQFVLDYLKDTTMHEVGHTLGLRHNFRSSRIYTEAQLSDPEFTRQNGLAGSVMEYAPINLGRNGERTGTAFQLTLGPYDYWAIEYAYRPLDPAAEDQWLLQFAARNAEATLAYGTDEDNFLGVDPESLQGDLGDDPVAFARKRIEIARELIGRQESRPLAPNSDYSVLRRSVGYALADMARAVGIAARQIGGVRALRDLPGSGRDPLAPVPATVQREALDLLARQVLSPDGISVSPGLKRRLAPDYLDISEAVFTGGTPVPVDYSVESVVLGLQRALLAQLMSDGVASRLLDSESKWARPEDGFRVSELYSRLTREIWSDLAGTRDILPLRRELQRDHVNRLAQAMVRPTSSRADTRALLRAEALALMERLNAGQRRPGLSPEARAHLADSAETLQQALQSKLQRAGV